MTDAQAVPTLGRRLLPAALVVAVLLAVASNDALHAGALRAIMWIEGVMATRPAAGMALFVVASALSAMIAFLSSAVLVPSAIALWGPGLTVVLLWTGWMLGGAAAWSIGARLAAPAVERLRRPSLLVRLRDRLGPSAPFSLVLLLQLALPSELPGYLLGVVRYPRRRYLLALALAELPSAIGVVLLAQGFVARRTLVLAVIGLLALLALAVMHALLHRRLATPR